jgi:hypothetical protein
MNMLACVISRVRRWTSVFFVPSSSHLNERLVGLARAGFGRDVGAQIAHMAAFLDRAVQQLPWLRENAARRL